MKPTTSRHALQRHRTTIMLTLTDLRAGKKVDHLRQEEVALLIAGLERRLAEVNMRLGENRSARREAAY